MEVHTVDWIAIYRITLSLLSENSTSYLSGSCDLHGSGPPLFTHTNNKEFLKWYFVWQTGVRSHASLAIPRDSLIGAWHKTSAPNTREAYKIALNKGLKYRSYNQVWSYSWECRYYGRGMPTTYCYN